jgi:hypothetical protein
MAYWPEQWNKLDHSVVATLNELNVLRPLNKWGEQLINTKTHPQKFISISLYDEGTPNSAIWDVKMAFFRNHFVI